MEYLLRIFVLIIAVANCAVIIGVCLLSFYKAKQTKKSMIIAVAFLALNLASDFVCLFWLKSKGMSDGCRFFGLLLLFTVILLYENILEMKA